MDLKPSKWQILIFVVLPLIPLFMFWILPMFASLWLSFTNWDYISPTFDYVGVDNYTNLLTGSQFRSAFTQTVVFTVLTVLPTLVLGFISAALLSRLSKTSGFIRGLLFSPYITPMVGMSIVFSWLFNPQVGPVAVIFDVFGVNAPVWTSQQPWAMLLVVFVSIWKNAGWAAIFYADAISRIPSSLFEVADVEGLSGWQRVKEILIPLVSPTTLFLTIMTTLDCLQAYDQINVLTQGGPAGTTRTLLYLFYQLGFEQFNMGQATALAMVILVISAILAFILIRVSRKHVYY